MLLMHRNSGSALDCWGWQQRLYTIEFVENECPKVVSDNLHLTWSSCVCFNNLIRRSDHCILTLGRYWRQKTWRAWAEKTKFGQRQTGNLTEIMYIYTYSIHNYIYIYTCMYDVCIGEYLYICGRIYVYKVYYVYTLLSFSADSSLFFIASINRAIHQSLNVRMQGRKKTRGIFYSLRFCFVSSVFVSSNPSSAFRDFHCQ